MYSALSQEGPDLQPHLLSTVNLAQALTTLPIVEGNSAILLDEYGDSIDRLIADIDCARQQVHLLYYIFADDTTGQRIAEALGRAAKRGVICRVLVDGLGSRPALRRFLPHLRACGVQARAISPPGWAHLLRRRHTSRLDLCNHRKIAIIDSAVAYTGSQNIVDPDFKHGIQYEELVVRLQGPIVDQLQAVFLSDWYVETHELLASPASASPFGAVVAQAVASGPEYQVEANQCLFISLLYGAQRRIVLTTPYFIPDTALLTALETAALRGVETHLILSQAAGQFLVSQAQRSFYAELLAIGVRIHLYQPRFLHATHLSIDDDVIVIGSSNLDRRLDRRSFSLNAEISVVLYGEELAAALHAVQDRYFADAHLLTAEEWEGRSRASRVVQNTCRLLDALL